jgi:hypothetical protein
MPPRLALLAVALFIVEFFDAPTIVSDGLALEIGHSIPAGEMVQAWARRASVFKSLNTTGFGNMADPGLSRREISDICGWR